MTDEQARAMEVLQRNAGIPHLPTPLTYELRLAISGNGPRAYDWSDKPHRLVYDACSEIERLTATALTEKDAEIAALRRTAIDISASLAAAISLLERGGKAAKKAAASDRMFDQMLTDYRGSLDRARTTLAKHGGNNG